MITEAGNKKTSSDTSVSSRRALRDHGERNEKDRPLFGVALSKKFSLSLNELDLSTARKYEISPLPRIEYDSIKMDECKKSLLYKTRVADDAAGKLARKCIVNSLMLNAWRKQKLEHKLVQEKMGSLNEKLECLEMQVYVLRQLLNAEKKRVESANDNIRILLQRAEETNREQTEMVKKKDELESKFNDLTKHCYQLEDVLRNQANEIITAKQEAENWEKQLEKEREKLKKMETEETALREKIKEVVLMKDQELNQLTQANRDLQQKWAAQVRIWDETIDLASEKLKESKAVKNELQKKLENRDDELKKLNSKVTALEKKLLEEDEKNGLLAKSILEKTNELTALEKKLQEISVTGYPWSGGILKMASICAKIPVACICTGLQEAHRMHVERRQVHGFSSATITGLQVSDL